MMRFPGDNQHWAAMPVKDSLLIRLVDGEPSAEPFGSEVDYLAAPLSIGIGAAEAWRVESVIDQDFLSPRLETPDVLVLANVASISPEEADRLNQLVTAGMGLLIFTGGKLDIGLYNDLLFRQKNRLLPCALKSLTDETIHGLFVEPLHPSPLEKLLDLKASALERVPVRQFMSVEEPAGSRAGARAGALEQSRAIAGGDRAIKGQGPRLALDHDGRPCGKRLADRAELRAGRPRGGPRRRPADAARQYRHRRRADAAGSCRPASSSRTSG